MKVTYDQGNLLLSVSALLDMLDEDAKRSFIDSLACDDTIIDYVVQQIVDGWTEMGSHGSKSFESCANPLSGLDKARRDISKVSDEIARKEIEGLEKALAESEKRANELSDKLAYMNRERYSV